MTEEEERAARYRQSRALCRTNLNAAERALAGNPAARAALGEQWQPLLPDEGDLAPFFAGCESRTIANRDCL